MLQHKCSAVAAPQLSTCSTPCRVPPPAWPSSMSRSHFKVRLRATSDVRGEPPMRSLHDCHDASLVSLGGPLGNMSRQIAYLLPDLTLPLTTPRAFDSASPTA